MNARTVTRIAEVEDYLLYTDKEMELEYTTLNILQCRNLWAFAYINASKPDEHLRTAKPAAARLQSFRPNSTHPPRTLTKPHRSLPHPLA